MKPFFAVTLFLLMFVVCQYAAESVRGNNYKEIVLEESFFNRAAVSGAQGSRIIELASDEMIVLRLPATPSTGYRWEITNYLQTYPYLKVLESSPWGPNQPEYEPVGRTMPGAPRMQLIRLVGNRKGLAHVTVSLRRPWTGGQINQYRLDVRSGGQFTGTFVPPLPEKKVEISPAERDISICAAALPSHFDWREQNAVTPVRDQESCGSCWAFGAVAAMEAKIKIKDGLTRDYAEQYLVSCNMEGYSCSGGWWAHDYHTMKCLPTENGAGARLETDFPYLAVNAPCNPPHTAYEQLESWAYTDDVPDSGTPTTTHSPTVAQVKEKIYYYGPVATEVCSATWGGYTGGVHTTDCTAGDHIVLITGWDDSLGCFYVKNSWGTGWGESGYIKVAYNTCGVGKNSTYLLYEKTNPRILYRSNILHEAKQNDGGIGNSLDLRIEDSTTSTRFAVTSGYFTSGTHYSVANLPAGLTLNIQALSATTAKVTVSGKAASHANANDVNNLTITFANAAFTGNNASAVENYSFNQLKINFFDPYQFVYYNPADVVITPSNPWQFYWLEGSNYTYGFGIWWYDGVNETDPNNKNVMKYESYTNPVLSYGTVLPPNVKPLNYGDTIGPASTIWAQGGSYGDQHTLAGPGFNEWKGQTRYLGFSFTMNGYPVYGWMRIQVSSDGQQATLLDYAWDQDPNHSIRAGYTSGSVVAPVASFSASPATVVKGGTVQFTDSSTGSPTSWSWSFPGGTPSGSSVQHPSVVYNTAGTYNVVLTVTNSAGSNTMTKTGYITVNNGTTAPTANFSGTPTSVAVGGTVQFTDSSIGSPTSWSWSFPGGTPSSSTLQNPSVVYNTVGTYNVVLTVSNAGGSNTMTKSGYIAVTGGTVSYCVISFGNPAGQYIKRVKVGGIDKSSTYAANGYSDYTNLSAIMKRGTGYSMTVTPYASWAASKCAIYIDWNRNGLFTDSGETVYSYTGSGPWTKTITPPSNAATGTTRMRVVTVYNEPIAPCGTAVYFGEAEDYTITVQ